MPQTAAVKTPSTVAEFYSVGVVSAIVNLLSLVFNIIAIKILVKIEKRTNNPVNVTFISLSVNNIMQCVASQLLVTPSCFMKRWIWGHHLCTFYAMWTFWLATAAIYLKVFLAWQHYSIISSKSIIRRPEAILVKLRPIMLCTLVSLLWCTLPLIGWSSYGYEGICITCSLNWHLQDALHISYTIASMFVAFVLPVFTLVVLYIWLFFFVKRNTLKSDSANNKASDKTEWCLIKLGLVMTITFVGSWGPYAIISLLTMTQPQIITPLMQTIPSIVAKCSTLALPIVYTCIHKEFQYKLLLMFGKKPKRRSRQYTPPTTDVQLGQKNSSGKLPYGRQARNGTFSSEKSSML